MKHHASRIRAAVPQYRKRIVERFSRVDNDYFAGPARDIELGLEGAALVFARREIVMVVQPDLADGYVLRITCQFGDLGERVDRNVLRVVWMNVGCAEHVFAFARYATGCDGFPQVPGCTYHRHDAGLPRPVEHRAELRVKAPAMTKITMRVYQT